MKLPHRKQYRLRWMTVFFPEWTSGIGRGAPCAFGRGTLVETTDSSCKKRPRVRVIGTEFQAYCTASGDSRELDPA
jgi:hypothetical protein